MELKAHQHRSLRTPVSLLRVRISVVESVADPTIRFTVHEIAGVVPNSVINSLLAAIGIDPESGMIDLDVVGNKGGKGYTNVHTTVKKIGRQGYSAGQVLQQVSPLATVRASNKSLTRRYKNVRPSAPRCHHPQRFHLCHPKESRGDGDG